MIDLKKEGNFPKIKKKKWKFLFLISLSALVLIFIFFALILPNLNFNSNTIALPTCGDGSFYNSCSLDKPYYCNSNGNLSENSSVCGCSDIFSKINDSCVSGYQSLPINSNFSYVLDGKNGTINLILYGGVVKHILTLSDSITYTDGQQPLRSDFILMRLNEPNQEVLLQQLVKDIENLAPNSKVDQARIAISLVQNIPWGSSGQTVSFGPSRIDYSRYPYQVLYDNQGLCGEKSELLAFILKDLGYGTAVFYYPSQNHEALGIKCPIQDSLNGTGYCFVETSGPSIISDSSLVYAGGETLNSQPQVIILSDGISLPSNLEEYTDAKTLGTLSSRGSLDPFSQIKLNQLEQKYGLGKVYNIG